MLTYSASLWTRSFSWRLCNHTKIATGRLRLAILFETLGQKEVAGSLFSGHLPLQIQLKSFLYFYAPLSLRKISSRCPSLSFLPVL